MKQTNKQCCAVLTCEAALKRTWGLMVPARETMCLRKEMCVTAPNYTRGCNSKGSDILSTEIIRSNSPDLFFGEAILYL